MARGISQYLRIYDAAGVTYQRWQNYYANTSVTWDSQSWLYVPFVADGFTAGISGDETNVTVEAAATSMVVSAFEAAISDGRYADLSIYQFGVTLGNDSPQEEQELIASLTGQVVGGNASVTRIALNLGSALSPIGSQIPPRKFTLGIMGRGVSQ
jgi:hypothetical protein